VRPFALPCGRPCFGSLLTTFEVGNIFGATGLFTKNLFEPETKPTWQA